MLDKKRIINRINAECINKKGNEFVHKEKVTWFNTKYSKEGIFKKVWKKIDSDEEILQTFPNGLEISICDRNITKDERTNGNIIATVYEDVTLLFKVSKNYAENIYKSIFNERLYNHIILSNNDVVKIMVEQICGDFSVSKTQVDFSRDADGYPNNTIIYNKIGMQSLQTFSEVYTLAVVLMEEWKKIDISENYDCYIRVGENDIDVKTRDVGMAYVYVTIMEKSLNKNVEVNLRAW